MAAFLARALFCAAALVSVTQAAPAKHATKHGAVASESKECTKAGIEILKKGGNAADAEVATVICVGVVGMYHSGIGGGGFALIRSPDGKFDAIDFRETAPAAASKGMYQGNYNGSVFGGLASGVPGEIRGMEYISKKYGKLPWADLLEPSIKLARGGFEVSSDLVKYMEKQIATVGYNFLEKDPSFAKDFAPNGTLVKEGDTIYRKRFANTLEKIAKEGPDAFYTGEIARTTIQALKKRNGTMTMQDLKDYSVERRQPEQIEYGNYRLTSVSAPSSGAVCLSILKIISGYENIGDADALNISTYRFNEAMRWAYGQRTQLGDPSFVPGLKKYQRDMLSDETAKEIREKVTPKTHGIKYYDPKGIESLETPGTSAIVASDSSGLTVTLTSTINLLFGNLIMVPETGIILNNEMNDFSIPGSSNAFGYIPSPNNFIKPGKRPLSSISPTVASHKDDDSIYFITGAAGGSRIITSVAQTLWHALSQKLSAAEALKRPRIHDQLSPNNVYAEYTYDNSTLDFLSKRGANVTYEAPGLSSVQAIKRFRNGTFEAAGEPRQKNSAGISF